MFSTLTLADSVKNLIDKHNTNTSAYDLTNDLNSKIQNIVVGFHKNKPLASFQYPSVFIEPVGKIEEHAGVGSQARRDMSIGFDVVSIVQYGLGNNNGREFSDRELIQLTDNLEYMFRNHTRLSSTSYILDHTSANTEYAIEEYNDTYNSISRIQLQIKARSL